MVWSVFHPLHNPVRLNANVRDIRAVVVGSTSFVFECQGLERGVGRQVQVMVRGCKFMHKRTSAIHQCLGGATV